jgi:hypothetical protein
MLTKPKLMLPFQIARAIQIYFARQAVTARPALVRSSEVQTSLAVNSMVAEQEN